MNRFIFLLLTVFISNFSLAQTTVESLYMGNLTETVSPVITLSWSIPSARENGDSLAVEEISGYEIYAIYPDGTDEIIEVKGGATAEHSIPIIHGPGDYSFAIASIDTDYLKSQLSDSVTTGVAAHSPPKKIPDIVVSVTCE